MESHLLKKKKKANFPETRRINTDGDQHTLFLMNLRARLSLDTFSSSMARLS